MCISTRTTRSQERAAEEARALAEEEAAKLAREEQVTAQQTFAIAILTLGDVVCVTIAGAVKAHHHHLWLS